MVKNTQKQYDLSILYVGNRSNLASDGKSFNTENHWALTLEKLGCKVDFVQENVLHPGTGELVELAKGHDMFLFTRTWDGYVSHNDLREIENLGIPTVSVHLDAYALIARENMLGLDSPFWSTQYVFSPENSIQARKVFKERNINQFYLPPAVFEDECYIADPVEKFKHDIIFVGAGREYGHPEWKGYRTALMDFLEGTYGDRFKHYGWPGPTIRGEELNQLYSSSKIAIGDSLNVNFTDSQYYSDRYFEAPGRGAFQIAPYIPGITDHFVDRKEIVLYAFSNWVQLKNLIDYYLDPANDEEREAIRLAGHLRTKRDNTYTQRMQHILQTLEQEGAFKNVKR